MKTNLENRKRTRVRVSRTDIKEGLRKVGLRDGEVSLVHSSLSSFGYVEGGPDAVIDALLEAVGPDGSIAMPAFTWDPHDKQSGVFDVANAKIDRSIGIIPEAFRRRKGTLRSEHICHSICAAGPHAEYLMGEGTTPFGAGSSFDRLYQLDSWNLFLGVGSLVCTALHMVEEHLKVPYRAYRDFRGFTTIQRDGTHKTCQSLEFLRKEGYENDFPRMDAIFAKARIVRSAAVGEAKISNLKIRDIFRVTLQSMKEDIGLLLTPASRELLRREYPAKS